MKKKSARLRRKMAGEQNAKFNMRLSSSLVERVDKALAATKESPKISRAAAVRWMLEPYCAFHEANGRRPHDFSELARWYLTQSEKK